MSKLLADRLGWSIDKSVSHKLFMANSQKEPSLGVIKDVPITLGACTITIDVIVIESTTYDIILGNNWLKKAHAELSYNKSTLTIYLHGSRHVIPVDFNRGIPSQMEEDSPDEDSDDDPEPAMESDEELVNVIQEDPMETRAQNWRKFTKTNIKHRGRSIPYPKQSTSTHHTRIQEESDNDNPHWIGDLQDNYSSGEEETFFSIPKHVKRTTPPKADPKEDPPARITLEEMIDLYQQDSDCDPGMDVITERYLADSTLEDRIEEAKRRFWGVDWKQCDRFEPKPRSFWLSNMLTPEEFIEQEQNHSPRPFLCASFEEQEVFWENYTEARKKQTIKDYNEARLPTLSNDSYYTQ